MNIQVEFALAQKCDLMIMGNSGYGDLAYNHMCCGFPLHDRGELPHRCICPPKVRLEQGGFTCEEGNTLVCGKDYDTRGGDITKKLDDPSNTKGAIFSTTKNVFQSKGVKVWLTSEQQEKSFMLNEIHREKVTQFVKKSTGEAKREVCKIFNHGPSRSVKC
jgi:hypothetical protein